MTEKLAQDDKVTRTPAFDPADRARIRSALIHYMKQHGIGVPTLLARIGDATGRSPDLIPQKTLQRFLAGSHRTNDPFLIPLHQFTKNLPVTEAFESYALARALAGFYRPPPAPPGTAAQARLAPGILRIFERIPQPGRSGSDPIGELAIAPEDSNGTVRIRERLFNPGDGADTAPRGDPPAPHYHYEGVVTSLPPLSLALMRSTLTGLPRIHWMTHREPGPLYTNCVEVVFRPPPGELLDAAILRLEPQTGGS